MISIMKIVASAVLFLIALCVNAAESDSTQENNDWVVAYQFALYFLGEPEKNPIDSAKQLIIKEFQDFTVVDEFNEKPDSPTLSLLHIADVQNQYVPPDIQSIGYFGRGVTKEQAEKVQQSTNALLVNFAYPIKHTFSSQYQALLLMEALSKQNKSLIWDEETREIFGADSWRSMRIDSWEQGIPSVQDQTVIHAYKNTEYVRAITLGMAKYGLPDIVVNDFPWSLNKNMGHLINLVAQSLVEGNLFDDDRAIELDISQIRHSGVREPMLESLLDNASPKVELVFMSSKPEEGDPDNALVEISFNHIAGESLQEKQDFLISALFGTEDSLVYVKHNNEILAASERAKKKLPELMADFNKGLAPGEYIHVKAPFLTPDGGNEWMWIEVIRWKGSEIGGLLKNEPFNIPGLKAGSDVAIDQESVFDYIRYLPDGGQEGNETGQLIQKYSTN